MLFRATTRPDFNRYLGRAGIQEDAKFRVGTRIQPSPAGSLLTCSAKYYPAHRYFGVDKVRIGAFFYS